MSNESPSELERAYLIHSRVYRNTSLLLEVFTESFGKVGLVAKGVRAPKSKWQPILQPFQPLLINWSRKGELGTLRQAEAERPALPLAGEKNLAGLYVNELIQLLLHRDDPHQELFHTYCHTLQGLADGRHAEVCLRSFELSLLSELGYGLDFYTEAETHQPIQADDHYQLDPARGFLRSRDNVPSRTFSGQNLLEIAAGRYENSSTLKAAKRISQLALQPLLRGRELKTRKLYKQMLRLAEKHNNLP